MNETNNSPDPCGCGGVLDHTWLHQIQAQPKSQEAEQGSAASLLTVVPKMLPKCVRGGKTPCMSDVAQLKTKYYSGHVAGYLSTLCEDVLL